MYRLFRFTVQHRCSCTGGLNGCSTRQQNKSKDTLRYYATTGPHSILQRLTKWMRTMVKVRRCQLLYHVFFAYISSGFKLAVGFARTQSPIVKAKSRTPVLPKVLKMSGRSLDDDFQSALIQTEDTNEKRNAQRKLNTNSALKTIISALLCYFIFTRRRFVARVFSDLLLEGYRSCLVRYPLRTKVLTGATLSLVGDKLAQLKESEENYDVRRAASFAAFDCCYRMFQHVAIPTIVRLGQGKTIAGILSLVPFIDIGPKSVAFCAAMERTVLYQFGVIPLFYYPVFFSFTGMIQGLSLKESFERAKTSFFTCWKRNLIFWIPAQFIMFGLIDEKWQIPFVCVMGIMWSLILSITAGKAKNGLKS
eukprot:scaffold2381_cov128-Cylindrotheca_fusiformis.AAC.2